ncbi:MAG: YceI family protein [Janthinobacterium lividum]
MIARILPLVALVAFAAPVAAQKVNTDANTVPAGSYTIDPGHTKVLFSIVHMGFTDYYGQFPGTTGTAVLDPRNPGADRVDVTVPVRTVSTTNATLDGELVAPDWFDAAKFPTMHFVSTSVTPTGPGTARVAGDLTLHGVTRPVVLDAIFKGSGVNPLNKSYTTGFTISGKILRSEFGVSKYIPMLSDAVDLIISAAFEKKPA